MRKILTIEGLVHVIGSCIVYVSCFYWFSWSAASVFLLWISELEGTQVPGFLGKCYLNLVGVLSWECTRQSAGEVLFYFLLIYGVHKFVWTWIAIDCNWRASWCSGCFSCVKCSINLRYIQHDAFCVIVAWMTNFQVHNGACFTLPRFYCIDHLGWSGNSLAFLWNVSSLFLSISHTYTMHCRVHTLLQLPSVMQEKIICPRVQL